MIEDELWLVLGIIILLVIGVLLYLIFSQPQNAWDVLNFIWNSIKDFRMPKPWRSS